MKRFYFVGGPIQGKSSEFFQILEQIGGSPSGWRIYPHAINDGRALHLVKAESEHEVLNYLKRFSGIYEYTDIVEIREKP
jgi:hypothetical protein